jgi:hypothetical protein
MIESYIRQSGGAWLFSASGGLDAIATLHGAPVAVALAEVYAGLTFES